MLLINPTDMLRQGLIAVKIPGAEQDKKSRSSNVRVFKSYFGKHPLHLCRVFRDLQEYNLLDVELLGRELAFKGFLIGNNYLKCYANLDIQSSLFTLGVNKTGELRWRFITLIAGLKQFKLKMPTQAEWEAARMLLSVDGTHARTNEPRDPNMRRNPRNFSYKNNFPGLNYQIVLHLWKNQIAYCNSGDPASTHDITAIREEFIGMCPENARVVIFGLPNHDANRC